MKNLEIDVCENFELEVQTICSVESANLYEDDGGPRLTTRTVTSSVLV